MPNPEGKSYLKPSSLAVTNVMKANKKTDTKPEVAIRTRLHRMGFRFRKDCLIRTNGGNCRPDILFRSARLAIFIDGCFWHFCPDHGHMPRSNKQYWEQKLNRNKCRDIKNTSWLKEHGWHVIRLWEHVPTQEAVQIITQKLSELKSNKSITV